MSCVAVNDIEVYYEFHGPVDGPRVLLITGTGNDLRADPQRAEHPLANAGFRVLMFDQRGLGQTSKPDRPYSMAEYADDAATLLTVLGWTSAAVIGISFGGMVAQHLAIRHPHLVERLVLACTSSGGEGGSSYDLLALNELPEDERIRTSVKVMDSRNDLSTSPPTWAPGFERLARQSAAARRFALEDPASARGALRQLEARAAHDTWHLLTTIATPTLCMGGQYDNQAPVDNVRRLAARIPNAHLEFFDGGHGFLLQDPAAWPAAITFLSGRSATGTTRAQSAQPVPPS